MELSDSPNYRNRTYASLLGKQISSSLVNWKTDSRKCVRTTRDKEDWEARFSPRSISGRTTRGGRELKLNTVGEV